MLNKEAAPPVGVRTVQGAAWTVLFATLGKAATLAAQLALAWFLLPQDFGFVALALSFTTIATVISGSAWRNLLIQSPHRFEEIAGQVFWLAVAVSVAVAVLLVAIAPLGGALFHQPRVASLIVVAALATPIQALTTVHAAALSRSLRFRDLARITFFASLLQNATAVTLAILGFGAYALVIPLSVLACFQALAFRLAAGPIALGRPQPSGWPALAAPVVWLMANALFASLQVYGPNFVAGLVHRDPATTGYYYWGFMAASQAVFLLATNLQGVFFPALSKLNADGERQFLAVRRSIEVLLICVVPVCVLQMLLARPVIGLLFHDRWLPAVPVLQWLSAGLVTQPVGLVAAAVLMARGQFRALAGVAAFSAVAATCGAALGASFGDQVQIAEGVAVGLLAANGYAGWRAFREFGRSGPALLRSIFPPMALGIPVLLLGGWTNSITVSHGGLVQLACTPAACLGLHALLVKVFFPQLVEQMRLRGRLGPAPAPESVVSVASLPGDPQP